MDKIDPHQISRHDFLKVLGLSFLGAGIASSCSIISDSTKADWLEINSIRIKIPRLSPSFNGYRLLQISDIHFDDADMNRERLADVIQVINQQKVDLVAITGDFITRNSNPLDQTLIFEQTLIEQLSKLTAQDGIVAVFGNHDLSDEAGIRQVMGKAGIRLLSNTVYLLQRGKDMLNITGISTHDDFSDRALSRLREPGATILLAHYPDFADQNAATGRIDLQISGHSHGGQVNLPGLGPLILPDAGIKYPSGLYNIGNMLLYTNRGLGTL
ncbi:MAG: metallophosphoesterase, partial [Chloroflexota bacterium]